MESQISSSVNFRISGYNQDFQKSGCGPKMTRVLIFSMCIILLFSSCKKDSYPPPPPPPPHQITITEISPLSGRHGDTIIITGTNFSLNPTDDTVKFNGITAVVQKASAGKLYVIVPQTSTGVITVNGISSTGPPFNYLLTVLVTTFAGTGIIDYSIDTIGYAFGGNLDGPSMQAKFDGPSAIYFDKLGNLFVEDYYNESVREISGGFVSTIADYHLIGYQYVTYPTGGEFGVMGGIALDASGNLYVSTEVFEKIRRISGGKIFDFAGSGVLGNQDGPVETAQFYYPGNMAFDPQGNLFVCEINDIRKISPAGIVGTFAGGGTPGVYEYRDGQGTDARFSSPGALTIDAQGNIYVTDRGNNRIRKITPSGFVSTIAGSGIQGLQDGPADSARFSAINGICLDTLGNLYVSDFSCIRKITPDGFVSTLAGTKIIGYADGPAATAKFYYPEGLAFDEQGNLYVADSHNQRIRKITFE